MVSKSSFQILYFISFINSLIICYVVFCCLFCCSYPGKIKENLHRTTLSVPAEISALLKYNPSLIAPAVRAFCERDPIDKRASSPYNYPMIVIVKYPILYKYKLFKLPFLQACRNMTHFRPENCIMSSVVFTRCLYAMLCHEKSVPEKRSGWSLPPPNSPTFKMYNLGYKVVSVVYFILLNFVCHHIFNLIFQHVQACGFEILIDRAKTSGNSTDIFENAPVVEIKDLTDNRGWSLYVSSLKKKGYFKVCVIKLSGLRGQC